MKFYSLVMRKKIDIPDNKITVKIRNGRRIAYGEYTYNGKSYVATRIMKG